jgi:hypothetical protein
MLIFIYIYKYSIFNINNINMLLILILYSIKSLMLNYFYSTSLCYLFQIETLGLLIINQNYEFINKNLIELFLIGIIGIPIELEYILLLELILLSLIIVFIVKIINYYIRFKKIEKPMIFKIIIKFFITNYLPLLLLNFAYLYYQTVKNKYIYTINIYLIVILLFVLPSIYLKILYGNRRYVDKKKYTSLFIRFKPRYKLWFLFLLFLKNLYFICIILKTLYFDQKYKYVYNYLIYFINFTKIYLEYKYQPFNNNSRNDNKYNNLFNIISIIFIIFNEITFWININIIEYIKFLLLFISLIMVIYLSIRNFKLNKNINDANLIHFNDLDI